MSFNITSFFEILLGRIDGKQLSLSYYIVSLSFVLAFYLISDFVLAKKEDLEDNKKIIVSNFMLEVLSAWAICACCLYMTENMLISVVFGILSSIFITSKLSIKSKKKEDNNEHEEKKDQPATINVVVNNNMDDEKEKEDLLPDFYEPKNLQLPDNICSLSELNIVLILEIYGYISPNQKFKMITDSLFETADEQVEKLLKMYVLDEKELKEAKAILNLIKLNNRLISKEEALQCILEAENKQKLLNQEGGDTK